MRMMAHDDDDDDGVVSCHPIMSQLLAKKIPFENHTLDKALYEMVLSYFVDTPSMLRTQLSIWPPSLYDPHPVIRVVEDALSKLPLVIFSLPLLVVGGVPIRCLFGSILYWRERLSMNF